MQRNIEKGWAVQRAFVLAVTTAILGPVSLVFYYMSGKQLTPAVSAIFGAALVSALYGSILFLRARYVTHEK